MQRLKRPPPIGFYRRLLSYIRMRCSAAEYSGCMGIAGTTVDAAFIDKKITLNVVRQNVVFRVCGDTLRYIAAIRTTKKSSAYSESAHEF